MKKKGITLKASSFIQEESDKEDLNELEEDDDFSFFIKRFNKFLRNKGNQRRKNFNPKKSYCSLNWLRGSTFNFEGLDILRDSIRHLSKKLLSFELAQRFNIQFRASQYIMGLNQTSE